MRDAVTRKAELLRAAQVGLRIGSSKQTVSTFLTGWLTDTAPSQLRTRTLERYEGIVRRYIVPSMGSVPLERLAAQHVAKLHSDCLTAMSPSSVRMVHAVLRSALRQALQWRLIDRNPADAVPPPKAKRAPMRSLTREEARQLLSGTVSEPHHTLYVLAVTTGMRLGELLGLRWSDVKDLDGAATQQEIHVQVALTRAAGRWELTEPKTDQARRTIALPQLAVRALRLQRTRQKEQTLAVGRVNWPNSDLVFTDPWGEPLYGGHVTERHLKPSLARLGLPPIRFHDLRHTAATLMLGQGVNPKIVSEMLGHTSVELTLDTYSHVLPGMQAVVANKMDEALG